MSASPGFTIVEVLVAAFVLTVAVLGTLALIDRANGLVTMSKQRVGAGNLAREVVEDARSLDYDSLTPTGLAPALQALPGLGGTGNPWTVTRRGIDYSLQVTACTFDDPKDGVASGAAPADACPSAGGGDPKDANPDDFRRVTATVSWAGGPSPGASHSVTFTSLIVNPSGGLGPQLTLSSPSPPQLTATSLSTVSMTATTSSPAASIHWAADDGVSGGNATGGPRSWTIDWAVGSVSSPCTRPTSSYVLDGIYKVTAQDFDDRGIPGDARVASVMLNRCLPLAPTGLEGGHDARLDGVIDVQWNPNPERDIVGYRLYELGADGTYPTGNDRLVCQTDDPTSTTCTDKDPSASATTDDLHYAVVALDRTDLNDPTSALRQGAPSTTLRVQHADGSPPSWPGGTTLSASIVDGLPTLSWSAQATGGSGGVAFYRIYRDTGTALADRYDATAGPGSGWTDSDPGASTSHTYWVTAVDADFNESAPLGPVTSP